jgi:tRNA G18 (ribose-2'-O)-methylase SpoU
MDTAPEYRVNAENDLFQILFALKENRRKRGELGEAFVESVAAIKLAAAAGIDFARFAYADPETLSGWARDLIAGHPGAQRIRMAKPLLDRLSDKDEASELIATVRRPALRLEDAALPAEPLILILDRPSSPGNLGSAIRSADAFGADLVVTTGHAADIYDPAAIRASLGAVFSTAVVHEESSSALEAWLAGLKSGKGALRVIGTDSGATASISEGALSRPLAILLGNEAKGLSVRLKAFVDLMVRIPMVGSVDSLNLACAASVFLHEATRDERR